MTVDWRSALPPQGWLVDTAVAAANANVQFWGPRDFAHGTIEDTGGPCRELVLTADCPSPEHIALIAAAPRMFLVLEAVLRNVPLDSEHELQVRAALEAAQTLHVASLDEIDGE